MPEIEHKGGNSADPWKRVAHNLVLVGSALAAVIMGFRVIGGYYVEQEKLRLIEKIIDTNARNVELIGKRLKAAERELDRRGPRILHNEKEIDRVRDKLRGFSERRNSEKLEKHQTW